MLCNHLLLPQYLFSFHFVNISSSVIFFSPFTHSRSLSHADKGEASGVEVLLAFGPPLGPSPAQRFGVASATSGFPNPFKVLAMSFRRLNTHQSYALANNQRLTNR